jgi:hypothetical protein
LSREAAFPRRRPVVGFGHSLALEKVRLRRIGLTRVEVVPVVEAVVHRAIYLDRVAASRRCDVTIRLESKAAESRCEICCLRIEGLRRERSGPVVDLEIIAELDRLAVFQVRELFGMRVLAAKEKRSL